MVSNGELAADDDAGYALTGRLLERRNRVDDAARPHGVAKRWDGTWEIAVVSLERRRAAARLELRRAATALHLGELREGVWIRPDNLDRDRLPTSREVLESQCVHFRRADSDITDDAVRSVFGLDAWVRDAGRLVVAMDGELDSEGSSLAYRFALSVAVVRQLQRDPLLPAELLPEGWPAVGLRDTYRRFDGDLKTRLNHTFAVAGF
jgi:phenylacetic acid degradation operon negative regulatory protein